MIKIIIIFLFFMVACSDKLRLHEGSVYSLEDQTKVCKEKGALFIAESSHIGFLCIWSIK